MIDLTARLRRGVLERPGMSTDTPARVAVSSCLAGERVRWDGGHRRDPFVADLLARLFERVPVCPEAELGLGTPRPPVDLVRVGPSLRMVGDDAIDHAQAMADFAARRLDAILPVDGWVLKSGSPSCGLAGVPVRHPDGAITRDGRGLFAAALCARAPLLPIAEESRLSDPGARASFLERVLAHRRLRGLFDRRWQADDVARFHAGEERLLLVHDRAGCDALGELVARRADLPQADLATRYRAGFLAALERPSGSPAVVLDLLALQLQERISARDLIDRLANPA